MEKIEYEDQVHYYLENGDGWVKVTPDDKEYVVSSIGKVPVELIQLNDGIVPDTSVRGTYRLGGLIDQFISNKTKVVWCKTKEPKAIVSIATRGVGQEDEFTKIRTVIAGLDGEFVKLTRRTTSLELDNNTNKRWLFNLDTVVGNVQATVGKLVAWTSDIEVEQAINNLLIKTMVRNTIEKFRLKMIEEFKLKFRFYSQNLESTDYMVKTTMTALTTFLRLTDPDEIKKAYREFYINYPVVSHELNELLSAVKDFSLYLAGIKEMTGKPEESSQRKVAIYFDAMEKFSSADTLEKLEKAYSDVIGHPNFLASMLETIGNLKAIYSYIIVDTHTTQTQGDILTQIRNDLNTPIFGTGVDTKDLTDYMNSI